MPKQASCLSIFILLSLLSDYSTVSANQSSYQSKAQAPSETASKAFSPESLPVVLNPDSPITDSVTQSPTYTSFPPIPNNIPDVETNSNETFSNAGEPNDLQTKGEEIVSQELAPSSSPVSVNDNPTTDTKSDETIPTSLSPNPNVDNSVLDARDTDSSISQENTSLPPSESIAISQASPVLAPNVDTTIPVVEENKSPALAPAAASGYVDTSDDGSFTQENQSSVAYVNAPAPQTTGNPQEIATQDYSSAATPPNTEPTTTQNPENVPELNDYSSLPKSAVPAPTEAQLAASSPESLIDPTIQMTPPTTTNDDPFGSAAPTTSQNTILPFNYKAEDEPVEPYEEEEDSWNGGNGWAGVVLGACVIGGVGGFVYQKRKKDNIRAQYHCLAKKEGV